MHFLKLNLDRNNIVHLLQEYCQSYIDNFKIDTKKVRKGQEEQFIIKGTLSGKLKEIKISFISNKNGSTTINYRMGKSQDVSHKIALYVKENGVLDNRDTSISSLNNVSSEDFNMVIELLSEDYETLIINEKKIDHGVQKKIEIETGEKITFNYFENNTLTITGRPLILHSSTLNYFITLNYLQPEHIFDSTVKYYRIETKYDEYEKELRDRIPIAYEYVPENIKALILSGIILEKIDVKLPDYSSFTFNILKALEGLMKHLLLEKGITINRNFDLFKKDIEPVEIRKSIKEKISCPKTIKIIEQLYEFYKKERHTIFHTECIDVSTRIIDKREDAIEILNHSLVMINNSYNILLN